MDEKKRHELLKAFQDKPDVLVDFIATDDDKGKRELRSRKRLAEIQCEREQDINKMRKQWSLWLLRSIVAIIVFDFAFVILLGMGWGGFSFEDNRVVFAFIIEHLVKIGGLAYIVVNFLFDKENGKSII